MANCKDCIHYDVCESDSEDVALNLTWANKCQHFKDKADVVPKSEVERLVDKWIGEEKLTQDEKTLRLIEALMDEAKRYEKYYFNHEYDKMIAEAKQEVASEIFEEIEELDIQLNNGDLDIKYFGSAIAKLKKKHTESEGKK